MNTKRKKTTLSAYFPHFRRFFGCFAVVDSFLIISRSSRITITKLPFLIITSSSPPPSWLPLPRHYARKLEIVLAGCWRRLLPQVPPPFPSASVRFLVHLPPLWDLQTKSRCSFVKCYRICSNLITEMTLNSKLNVAGVSHFVIEFK